jgi:hypothetical protein
MIDLDPKPMRIDLKLPKMDFESMHLTPKHVRDFNNKDLQQHCEVLYIEGHLRVKLPYWVNLKNLNIPSKDVLFDNPIELLLGMQESTRGIKGVFERRSQSTEIPTD